MSKTMTHIEENAWAELNLDETALQNLLDKPLANQNSTRLRDGEQHLGFDNNVGDTWIYPNNLPCRSYQMSIVQAALYNNTLVVLPTGLGKTFIAAVVMYNFYRWYPRGKVLFLAPTRPLVNQQIEACQNIMPFPKRDTIEMTGKLQRSKRTEIWKNKRVFFATPQVVQSDIFGARIQAEDTADESCSFHEADNSSKTVFPYEQIKLIVIDEAHKAKGKYAYTEVVQAIGQRTKYFRILALSATPGRTMDDVAEVCRNLFISHIEVRWDTSIDVLPYIHKRTMDTVVVTLGEKIKEIREQLLQIVDPYLRQLTEAEVLSGSLTNINRNYLLYEQKRFRERSLHMGRHPQHSAISSNFAISISLYHALELLERHGLRVFLNNFEGDEDGKDKFVLQIDGRLRNLIENLKQELGPNPFEISAAPMTNGKIAEIPKNLDFGHPKFEKARECMIKHFENNKDSRAIVFCEYRESVMLIYRLLLQHTPLLRPRCFVGQGGTTGALRALTQKQQIQIMKDFREGKSNILIATSIGEEGIDVGEVELIVCFDISTSNPTRFVQRIGRTGRKKKGHVIMLVTEGREHQLLREVLANKDQTNKKLLKSSVVQQALYKHAPRLVPTEFKPKCIQTFVKPPSSDDEEKKSPTPKKGSSKSSKPLFKGSQDLRKFFNAKPKALDKEDLEYFEIDTNMTQAKPGLQTQQRIVNKLDKMKNLFKDLQLPNATQTQKVNTLSPGKKLSSSQVSVKDYFLKVNLDKSQDKLKQDKSQTSLTDSLNDCNPASDKSPDKLKQDKLQTSFTDSLNDCNPATAISLSDEESDTDSNSNSNIQMDPELVKELRKLLRTTWTTPAVLKRAKINDLGYHLKSKEMSQDMKKLLLKYKPEYIKENLEQMQVLLALQESDSPDITEEEKSIREINAIILELFGGITQVEEYLQEVELQKIKQKSLQDDLQSEEEEDSDDMEEFHKKLDNIFDGLGDGQIHDNYDWIQERLQQTARYKELIKSLQVPTPVQESMVYDTVVEPADEADEYNFEDFNITDSKYCSQWQEFNKPDIVFKSTPLQSQASKPIKIGETLKRTSLLEKLVETKEEGEEELHKAEEKNNEQLKAALEMLDKKLQQQSLIDMLEENSSQDDSLEELEKCFKAKREAYEKRKLAEEEKFSSQYNFKDLNSHDDEEILIAAAEAEAVLKLTQNKEKNVNEYKTDNLHSHSLSSTPEIDLEQHNKVKTEETSKADNTSAKLSPPSLNTTPELDLNESIVQKTTATSITSKPLLSSADKLMQHELDIDMEAFMQPFPEEQELMKTSLLSARRESLKENLITSAVIRESPDLFADEHIKSPTIKKPIAFTANMASTSTGNTVACFKSPQKRLNATQNPCDQHNNSPTTRLSTDKQKYEKSPSLFDMYLKSTKGKGKLPKSLSRTSSVAASMLLAADKPNNSARATVSEPNESLIVMRKTSRTSSKRKIFDSDSEDNDTVNKEKDLTPIKTKPKQTSDSELEEVAATQANPERCIVRQRRKRRRLNSFIQQEAAVSGSDHSEDDDNNTIGCYLLDSLVVSSDDEDPDQASTTHMQAMYLQSLKSPQQKRGTFKIPAPRIYNDHSRIFSQPVLPADTYSQYVPDSFVVNEEDVSVNDAEVSMCPLERAEKLLKERRKAKKQRLLGLKSKSKCKKKIQLLADSSEDEENDNDFE